MSPPGNDDAGSRGEAGRGRGNDVPADVGGLAYVIVVAEGDPVARRVGERWGTPERYPGAAGEPPLRRLAPGIGLLRRPGLHIHDDGLRVGGIGVGAPAPTLVFPSVHRSANSRETLTVHPLGNPGDSAEVGGLPRTFVPADARRMTDALRRVAELAERMAWPASFEATHHGPHLVQPAFFVEIGAADFDRPPEEAVRGFAELLSAIRAAPEDRVAVGIGGGHYAPHFTELALERRWAFGHLLPRHALASGGPDVVRAALAATSGVEGLLYHRAQDALDAPWVDLAPRLRERDAPSIRGEAPGP